MQPRVLTRSHPEAQACAVESVCNASQNMSGIVSGGAAAKRQRQQLEEDEAAEAELGMTARPKVPIPLQCVIMWIHGTLIWLQLCNPQGVSLFSFVRLPPPAPSPAGASVCDMSLTHEKRLRALGCGFTGKLVQLLLLGVGRHFEPQMNWGVCHKMIYSKVRHSCAA